MFVFKQQKYQTRACFCFRTCFFCFDYCVLSSSLLVSHLKMVVFKQKISDKSMFLFSNMVCFVLIIVF